MTEEIPAPNEAHDEQDDAQALTFEDLQNAQAARLAQRKDVIFELPEGDVGFTIRMLTAEEFDEVEESAIRFEQSRNGNERRFDSTAFKNTIIQKGVTGSTMPDWKNTDRHINALPKEVRNELADAIDDFAELDDETVKGFR